MKPKILFYDIETTYLLARVWSLGEQVVRHGQLVKGMHYTKIICVTYCWNDGKPGKAIGWDYDKQDSGRVIREFDKLVSQADVIIGKNSDRFDNKHVNTIRLLEGLPAVPTWMKATDDLEKHVRKYFKFPSNGLDYLSALFEQGGKMKMEFQDWIDIVEKTKNGRKSYRKMLAYGIKDVEDTRALWNKIEAHIEPRVAFSANLKDLVCKRCGSSNLKKNGVRWQGRTQYQEYRCTSCHMYAGRKQIK